jgi:hypothetical protein
MTSSWLAGLTLVKVPPDSAATHRPPIRFWYVVVDTGLLVSSPRRAVQGAWMS